MMTLLASGASVGLGSTQWRGFMTHASSLGDQLLGLELGAEACWFLGCGFVGSNSGAGAVWEAAVPFERYDIESSYHITLDSMAKRF